MIFHNKDAKRGHFHCFLYMRARSSGIVKVEGCQFIKKKTTADCKMFGNPSTILGNLLFKLPIESLKSPLSNERKVQSLWGSQWFNLLKTVCGCEKFVISLL